MATQKQRNSQSANVSIQASSQGENPSHVNGVMVGENREHFSLLRSNRQQPHRHHNYDRTMRVQAMIAESEHDMSTDGDDNASEDRTSTVSVLVMNQLSSYYRLMCNRHPKGKGVFIVLILCFLETFAFVGTMTGVKRLLPVDKCHNCQVEHFWLLLLLTTACRVLYPVAGVIADSYLGRYTVIHIGLWLVWIGFALSALSASLLRWISSAPIAGGVCEYVITIIVVILFSAGLGSVEAAIIPFGADQLAPGASSDEFSSYFYYYYMARNIAVFVATLILFTVFDEITFFSHSDDTPSSTAYKFNTDCGFVMQNLIAILVVTLALLILFHFRKHFYRDKQHSNAFKSVTSVLCYAARVKRQLPQRNRAFRYGGALTSRIDLAKEENDGTFTSEEVEDVKTFYRMLLLILSLFVYFVTYGAVSIMTAKTWHTRSVVRVIG